MTQSASVKIIRNTLWNFWGHGWMLAVSFFTTPFIVRGLDVNLYGIYALVGVVVGYFAFLQLGLGSASVKYISEYLARGEYEKIRSAFWACLSVYAVMGVAGASVIYFLAPALVEKFFNIQTGLKPVAIFALRVGAAGFVAAMVSGAVSGVLRSVGKFGALNFISTVAGTSQLAAAVFLLKTGHGLKEIVVSNVAVNTAAVAAYWYFAQKYMPVIARPKWDPAAALVLLRYGGFVTLSGVLAPVLTNVEKLFLTTLRSAAHLTYYYVPFSVMNYLTVIPSSLAAVLFPTFSYYQHADDKNIGRELHFRSTVYILFLYLFPVLFFLFFGGRFFELWLGRDFALRSSKILAVLSVAGLLNAVAYPSVVAIQGFGKPHIPALFYAAEIVLYVPASYFLTGRFGGIGAASAWLLRALMDTALLNKAACDLTGVSALSWYLKFARRIFLPASVCCALLAAVGFWGSSLLEPATLAGILLSFGVYCFTVWEFGLDAVDKDKARLFVEHLKK